MSTMASLLLFAQLGASSAARAAPSEEEALIQEGVALRRAGEDADALAAFTRALSLGGSAQARAQMGLANHALGRWSDAERDLSAALLAIGDPWIEQHHAVLEADLHTVRAHLAWIKAEAPVPVAPHEHPTLEAHAIPRTLPALLTPSPSMADSSDPHSTTRFTAWMSLATAVALSAGVAVALDIRESNAATYNSDNVCYYGGLTRDQRCGGYRDAVSTAQTMAIVGIGASVVAAGAAAILFAVSSPVRGRPARTGMECVLGMGVRCGGSF